MKLTVKKPAVIKEFLVQGTLDTYQPDKALSNVLKNIGSSGFDKLDVPVAFKQGLKFYLENSGYLFNDKLTIEGQKIAESGSLWKSLEGRFVVSVLYCEGKQYLWSCSPLVDNYRDKILQEVTDSIELPDEYTIDGRKYRNFDFRRVRKQITTQNSQVKVIYNFTDRSVYYECEQRKFVNPGNFGLLSDSDAEYILSELVTKYDFLTAENGILRCSRIPGPVNEALFRNILIKKDCHLEPIESNDARLDDISFGLASPDVVDNLFCLYITLCSENEYCPIQYLPSLFSEFSSIFQEVCDRATDYRTLFSKALRESTGKAHLRLQACLDLDPHTERGCSEMIDLSGKEISANDLAGYICGDYKGIRSVCCISKFISINPQIACNTAILADAIFANYGVPLTVVTGKASSRKISEEQKSAYDKFEKDKNVIVKNVSEPDLRIVHDRYYRVVYDSGTVWIKMTGELDAVKYSTENPDRSSNGRVKELTIMWTEESSIPEFVKKYMGVSE